MFKKTLLIATLLCAATATAQTATTANAAQVPLSLDECIRIALNDNPTIKVNDMEIERVDYAKKEVIGQLFPSVNFSAQYTRNLALQTIYIDAGAMGGGAAGGEEGGGGNNSKTGMKMGRDNNHNVGFSASIPIFVPALWKSIKLSDNQILQNLEASRANKLSLVNQVKNAYYALLLAKDTKKVIEQNHSTAQFNADVYKRMFELGTASEYDVLRANVAVTNLEPSILEAENSIKQLELQLKVLMGMDATADIEAVQSLDEFKGAMYDRAIMADTSLVYNTSLKSLDLQTDYLKKALDVTKASWLPTITGSGNYMWASMSNGSPFKNFMWNGVSSVGLTLAWPIFQGGQRYYKQKQAEVAVREMSWQRENLERSLHTQVQTQIDNLNKSIKQIESNNAGVEQATKASEIMQQSFKIGAASFIQLRDTEDALMNARLSYYQAIYNYLVADSNLEYVLGNTEYVAQ
ncbi:MAG: TolC family protein [Bacteroidales bacterium]|nr:TolC family protein [Candidatus Sodaliphilus aphodohippi]